MVPLLLDPPYGAGLRRSELVALDLTDYNQGEGSLIVRSGKGGKDRIVYIEAGATEAMTDWLAARGAVPGALFNPVNKGHKVQAGQRMTDQVISKALKKRAKAARLQTFSPHDLRRTLISDLLDAGGDIATVQKLAGHASVETTARYDRRGEATKKRVAGMLHVPYRSNRLSLDK